MTPTTPLPIADPATRAERGARPPSVSPSPFPLTDRVPALAAVPRARLGTFPTPLERIDAAGVPALWIKRDDLASSTLGGNKVRALEFLLARVRTGDTVITVGSEGSTHVLATAVHAATLGAATIAVRWPQVMHAIAESVRDRADDACADVIPALDPVTGHLLAFRQLLQRRRAERAIGPSARRTHWIPMGGSSPLGALGHVNAGLELAAQIARGEMPAPAHVVVPLGTGGTAAGIAVGLAMAGSDATVVGVRVGPSVGPTRLRVLRLAWRTARLVERYAGRGAAPVHGSRLRVEHGFFAGAYGRPHPLAEHEAARFQEATGIVLDATYSAKALAAALRLARGAVASERQARASSPTLFWLTFDARCARAV
jgi:1-aminocyclopropane-1-carboxylate deaminase/D-cysteine desulfhydrase-like pyridoxal-dependent ACC family enzyme